MSATLLIRYKFKEYMSLEQKKILRNVYFLIPHVIIFISLINHINTMKTTFEFNFDLDQAVKQLEPGILEWWIMISRLMLDPLFFLISRLT